MTTKFTKKPAEKPAAKSKPEAVRPVRSSDPKKPLVAGEDAKPAKGSVQPLRGMRDVLPAEQKYWRWVYQKAEELATAYSYERIDTPILEETALFNRTAGKQSDVVEKEMFSFIDKGGDDITLRPEGTASLVRAYVSHGMLNLPQPVKLYYWGPMFRHEKPQHGRFRQHTQFGIEVFGEAAPAQDAEIILLAHLFYRELGTKTSVNVNSLGCNTCRPTYMTELAGYYRNKRNDLCEDCKRRYAKNPLRLLDCKEEQCQAAKAEAPQIVNSLCDECRNHFFRVIEYLDDMQVPYIMAPHLVRGFDYYTKTVFEVIAADDNSESAGLSLGGGGRYDGLIEQMGGRPTPACGFGIGIERAILCLKQQSVPLPEEKKPDVFLAQLGETARRRAFVLFEELRQQGIKAAANFSKASIKGQLEVANRLNAPFTLILGQEEILKGTIIVRDMEAGVQETIDYNKVVSEMRKKLGKV